MKLVRHYRAQAEGCLTRAQQATNENLRNRYMALAEAYLALAAEREIFLKATQSEETLSAGLGTPTSPENRKDQSSSTD